MQWRSNTVLYKHVTYLTNLAVISLKVSIRKNKQKNVSVGKVLQFSIEVNIFDTLYCGLPVYSI